jgi:hypothetical protein
LTLYASLAAACCLGIALMTGCSGGNEMRPTSVQPNARPVAATTTLERPVSTVAFAAPARAAGQDADPTAPAHSPKQAVIAALQAQMTAGPYRMQTTVVSKAGTLVLTGELIPPDKLHMITQRGEHISESIYIGDRGWKKVDGRWIPLPINARGILAQMRALTAEELDRTIGAVQRAGTDSVDGQPAFVYTYTATVDRGGTSPTNNSIKLWVSTATGLPIKLVSQGEVMGVQATTTQRIEHDPSITVEPPDP